MTTRRGVRERVKARREEIVRKAAQAFRERGYHNTSIEDIAKEFNLTKASLYYYVDGKQDLLFEAHRFAMAMLLDGLKNVCAGDGPPREKLERAIHHHIRSVVDELSLATMLLQQEYALSAQQRRKIVAMRDEYDALVRGIIRTGVAAGVFRAVDARVAAFAILGALNWMPHWFSQSGPLSKEEIGEMFADHLIGGLLADTTSGRTPARAAGRLFDMDGRVVVVTGAARGIGRVVAGGLARQGAHVVLVDRDPAGLGEVARAIAGGGGESEVVEADVARAADVEDVRERAIKRFGQIDGLVHAAGAAGARPFLEMDEDEWNRVLEVNLGGAFRIVRAVAAPMAERREGSIVLIGGVEGLVRTLALELAPHGIRANAIAPGMTDAALAEEPGDRRAHDVPPGRLARGQDYVGVAAFLLAPASSHVTGHVLSLDGGALAR